MFKITLAGMILVVVVIFVSPNCITVLNIHATAKLSIWILPVNQVRLNFIFNVYVYEHKSIMKYYYIFCLWLLEKRLECPIIILLINKEKNFNTFQASSSKVFFLVKKASYFSHFFDLDKIFFD